MAKKLTKGRDKWLFGVCSGIAQYLDIDPTVVRLVWLLLILFVGTGVLVYIILAILMPRE